MFNPSLQESVLLLDRFFFFFEYSTADDKVFTFALTLKISVQSKLIHSKMKGT